MPRFLSVLDRGWRFYWASFKLSLIICLVGVVLLIICYVLRRTVALAPFVEQILITIGAGMLLISLFNVLYEVRTRDAFRDILASINPNVSSGVVVHATHEDVLPRKDAIERYLARGETMRIITATADNYTKRGQPARDALVKKILQEKCRLKIVLYLPVYDNVPSNTLGQRHRAPQEILDEHRTLMPDYEDMIRTGKGRVAIRFCASPLHINFMMIGQERMFSAPILFSMSGPQLPCYEIFPTGGNSLFHKFQKDFDFIFANPDTRLVLDFDDVKRLYEAADYRLEKVQELFLKQQASGKAPVSGAPPPPG